MDGACHVTITCFTHLIQGLVGVGDQQCPLVGVVMVEIRDDLNGHIRLSCAWRSHNQRQSWLHPRHNGLHLCWSKGYSVPGRMKQTGSG
jgi:hypothetical protein